MPSQEAKDIARRVMDEARAGTLLDCHPNRTELLIAEALDAFAAPLREQIAQMKRPLIPTREDEKRFSHSDDRDRD